MEIKPEQIATLTADAKLRIFDIVRSRMGAVIELGVPAEKQEAANRLLAVTLEHCDEILENLASRHFPEVTLPMITAARKELQRNQRSDRRGNRPTHREG